MMFLFIHFLFAFWILAGPEVLGKYYSSLISIPIASAVDIIIYKAVKILCTLYGLILAAFALILLVILILRYVKSLMAFRITCLHIICFNMCKKCKKTIKADNMNEYLEVGDCKFT